MANPKLDPARFEHAPQTFVSVAIPKVVYIGVADREAFDRIALPLSDRGPSEKGHVLTNAAEDREHSVMIVFQHWLLSRTVEAFRFDWQEEQAAKEGAA